MVWRASLCLCLLATASAFLLPGDVRPAHYDLRLLYDLDPSTNYSFFGVVDILLSANKPTSKIILHAKDFNVTQGGIILSGHPSSPRVVSAIFNDTIDFLTLTLDKGMETGVNYTLTIPFYGHLKIGLDGVYISSYVNKMTKNKEYLITTQFEAISARKGFPCFDEPMYKATYSIIIGHHKQFTAISNMPLKTRVENNVAENIWPWQTVEQKFKKGITDFVFDEFEKSVPMSTYLVAFVVSKFSYVESPADLSTTKFRIWARKDAIDQTAYAANIGPRVLTHFEKFFNVSFPLPKQDMIAIPDFSAGAMENWGLITYRETALLYDKQQSSFLNKERVAEVIAHELAHQWFGNLVTMKWWSDLWLNEGFATFVASIGVGAVEPDWNADRSYAVDNLMAVLNLDALESSHPVSVPITDPKRISEIFDQISYRKGSTLIRMMTRFLGESVFRKAIHNYLIKYSYQNAEQDDLWRELTAVSRQHGGLTRNVTVKEVMDTWTTQTGYPLLTVNRDYTDNSLTITQKRYLSLGARATTSSSWWVPLRVLCEPDAAKDTSDTLQWLADSEGVSTLHRFEHDSKADEWVLFNYDMVDEWVLFNYDMVGEWSEFLNSCLCEPDAKDTSDTLQWLADSEGVSTLHRFEHDSKADEWVLFNYDMVGEWSEFLSSCLCEPDAAKDSSDTLQWLADSEGVSTLHRFEHDSKADEWVLFNYDMVAPYRVNYDKRNWKLLSDTLNSDRYTNVPVLGRVQLLSDALALAWTNRLDYSTALQITSYLRRETEENPLSVGLTGLAKIETVLKRTPDFGAFQKFVRRLITDTYQRAGGLAAKKIIDGDNLNSVKMQVMTSNWACLVKVPGCEENAIELFQQWMDSSDPDNENPIPLDLRKTVYCVGISRGSVRHWRFALARLQRANVAAARDQLLAALACTRELWILTQYLEWAITEGSEVRRQDAATVIVSITRSTIGYYVAKDFIYNRIADIHKAFRGQATRLGTIIKILLDQFTTQRELDEFVSWRDKHQQYLTEVQLALQQAQERAAVNIGWSARNRRRVVDLMREFSADQHQSPSVPIPRWKGQPNFMLSLFAIHNISSSRESPLRYT